MKAVLVQGPTAIVDGKKVIHLCSNDYLGLAQNQRVIRRAAQALEGVSQCSSRLIAGNSPRTTELEASLAVHRGTEAALVFPTGYMANLGAITALAGKNSTILGDELNHASIIDACKLSGATVKIFRHNDTSNLEGLMRRASGRKIVVTEGMKAFATRRAPEYMRPGECWAARNVDQHRVELSFANPRVILLGREDFELDINANVVQLLLNLQGNPLKQTEVRRQ